MKWIITYTNDRHGRDRDNYSTMEIGESEKEEGNTLKEAIENLIRSEATPDMIMNYVEKDYDYYRSIDIISVYKVEKEVQLDFENIPAIKKKIEEAKVKHEKGKMYMENKEKENLIAKEKATLKKLKRKYE